MMGTDRGGQAGMKPGVTGTVTANDGSTLTVTSKAGPSGTPARQAHRASAKGPEHGPQGRTDFSSDELAHGGAEAGQRLPVGRVARNARRGVAHAIDPLSAVVVEAIR